MRIAALALTLLLPLIANAQVYTWKDAKGKLHYSDQPPADQSVRSSRMSPSGNVTAINNGASDVAKADKRQEAAKNAADAKEKAAQAEKKQALDAERQVACERARYNLNGLESGQIRFRMSSSGEREALDGDVREQELAIARQAVNTNCNPQ